MEMEVGFGWPEQNITYKSIMYRTKTLETKVSYYNYIIDCKLVDREATAGNLQDFWIVEGTCCS